MKKRAFIFFLGFIVTSSTNVFAQTTYKSDADFFTPVVKSLYLRGGSFEETQLIGPAVGYRFNRNYDITLHTEFLSSENKFNNSQNPQTTLLNLGVILGRTDPFSKKLLLRSKASIYKSIVFQTEGYENISKPALTSGLISSSFYRSVPLSGFLALLPNIGAFLGAGNYDAPISSASLRQGMDGFVVGPRLGIDILWELSDTFYLVAKPEVNIPLTSEEDYSESTF